MKIRLQFLLFGLLLSFGINAQTTILDFETPETSTTFQYFGNGDLSDTLNNIIANPDPSGINTSATVGEFVELADSETWAGGFANPQTMPVNVVAGNTVCMKVWFPVAGNMALKLESGTKPNWITTQDVTETNTWVEVCFDTNEPSIEDPMDTAAGGVFNQVTIFFDFLAEQSEDLTYYFDDIIVGEGTADPADITFSVDMNNYIGEYTNVYVSGEFNGWAGDANQLMDADGDGVFTGTVAGLTPGTYEYKFTLDNWTAQEDFTGLSYSCTVTDPSGEFVNRKLGVGATETLETVCWNSCYACGDAVEITVNLGAQAIDVDSSGLFIAGGGNFGVPGDNPLLDEDGDEIYSMTYEREVGFESFYTFTNGACGDFSCKEDISGQSCADPNNFNDRFMGPITENTTISTCFGVCTTDTDCEGGGNSTVTFSVDMNDYSGSFNTVFVSGTFNGWNGGANPMSDDDGDGIYTTSVDILPSSIEYKFQLDEWTVAEEFTEGDPCTVTNGGFTNRALEVGASDVEVCFLWNTCEMCETSGGDPTVTFSVDMNDYTGSFTTAHVSGNFNGWSGDGNPMSDDDGDGIWTAAIEIPAGEIEYKFTLDNWAVQEEFMEGDPCTKTTDAFTNRVLVIGSEDIDLCYEWNTCTECETSGVSSIEAADDLFVVAPSLVQTYTTILFNETYASEKELILFNALGQIVKIEKINTGKLEYRLTANDLSNGLYYLNIQTEGVQQTQKFIVNR